MGSSRDFLLYLGSKNRLQASTLRIENGGESRDRKHISKDRVKVAAGRTLLSLRLGTESFDKCCLSSRTQCTMPCDLDRRSATL